MFFGENVPAERVARCYDAVEALGDDGALLVAGSSPDRHERPAVRQARRGAGTPVVIVNRGETRGDELASYKLEVGCSEFLTELCTRVSRCAPDASGANRESARISGYSAAH